MGHSKNGGRQMNGGICRNLLWLNDLEKIPSHVSLLFLSLSICTAMGCVCFMRQM